MLFVTLYLQIDNLWFSLHQQNTGSHENLENKIFQLGTLNPHWMNQRFLFNLAVFAKEGINWIGSLLPRYNTLICSVFPLASFYPSSLISTLPILILQQGSYYSDLHLARFYTLHVPTPGWWVTPPSSLYMAKRDPGWVGYLIYHGNARMEK